MVRSLLLFICLCASGAAVAQDRRPSHCIAVAEAAPGVIYLHNASFQTPVAEHSVRLRYLAHSAFLIQTSEGLSAVTDFTGFVGNVDFTPDVVTMNHAHETHWTAFPDPAIPHVLRGWSDEPGGAAHHLDLGSMLIRNVPTDIRSAYHDGVERHGNSIFVFEVAGLCIGHLGHLHHMPDDAQFAALGRMDVVMAPVDGGMTLDLPTMIALLQRLKASVVIPMHWFHDGTLGAFLAGMASEFAIESHGAHDVTLSLRTLPERPTVIVLRPKFLTKSE
ncbi:MBL fold metallo-hydrolase [Roseovarius pelagicus]|uniref:MBL fold metallo-hydrolase n=1 Tax=Roseovarius pelagicus TaxID=2980108 RepID=A0ABY6D8P6_9RHOB|nr:MBL fold metallo-hydrolase [Roseovarius pelagicus]UXX82496.1 MBL fold metallo-hydrolase [Roseovarius pelagicus]